MDISHPVSSQITSVSFAALSSDDVRRISVLQVSALGWAGREGLRV